MFLRLYLFGRSILSHSRLVRNASLRSFGYLNRVSIDFFFLLKTALEQWPGRCILAFCMLVFLVSSWSLRACNYRSTTEHLSMADAMWLSMITFATVGKCEMKSTILRLIDERFSRIRRYLSIDLLWTR